jgi:hypothetical protein
MESRSLTRREPVVWVLVPVLHGPLVGRMRSARRAAVENWIRNRTKYGELPLDMGWNLPAECPDKSHIRK